MSSTHLNEMKLWEIKDGSIKFNMYKFQINPMKILFLVNFYILVLNSAQQQGSLESNINNLIYTYQNLMGPNRSKNRQTILHHSQISYSNELKMELWYIFQNRSGLVDLSVNS